MGGIADIFLGLQRPESERCRHGNAGINEDHAIALPQIQGMLDL